MRSSILLACFMTPFLGTNAFAQKPESTTVSAEEKKAFLANIQGQWERPNVELFWVMDGEQWIMFKTDKPDTVMGRGFVKNVERKNGTIRAVIQRAGRQNDGTWLYSAGPSVLAMELFDAEKGVYQGTGGVLYRSKTIEEIKRTQKKLPWDEK